MNVEPDLSVLAPAPEQGYGNRLTAVSEAGVGHEMSRLAAGLGLAALYGLAIGARSGGAGLLRHAVGVPFGVLVTGAVAVPALFVVLALLDAPITPSKMLSVAARSVASTGLVLSGLAPAAAMLVVTITAPAAASSIAGLGFVLAGGIGLVGLWASLRSLLAETGALLRMKSTLALCAFNVIAVALASRVWSGVLPIFGGASW